MVLEVPLEKKVILEDHRLYLDPHHMIKRASLAQVLQRQHCLEKGRIIDQRVEEMLLVRGLIIPLLTQSGSLLHLLVCRELKEMHHLACFLILLVRLNILQRMDW